MGTAAHLLRIKQPEGETDRSPPFSSEVKNAWSYTSNTNTSSWCGA